MPMVFPKNTYSGLIGISMVSRRVKSKHTFHKTLQARFIHANQVLYTSLSTRVVQNSQNVVLNLVFYSLPERVESK